MQPGKFSPRLRQLLLAVAALCAVVAAVSLTGGLPEPWGTRIGQNISRGGHFPFLFVSWSALIWGRLCAANRAPCGC